MYAKKRDHFLGKSVREHLSDELSGSAVEHGEATALQGKKEAFYDAMRDLFLVMGAFFFLCIALPLSLERGLVMSFALGLFFCFWKTFRSAMNAWTHLKKIHHIAYEERCEILANREQEREELLVLYQDKGFSGPLLERVVDVLMADHERLLQVMLQEELGLPLTHIDHPLQTALWTFFGGFLALFVSSGVLFWVPPSASWILLSLLAGGCSGALTYKERSIQLRAFVWTATSAAVAFQAFFLVSRFIQ